MDYHVTFSRFIVSLYIIYLAKYDGALCPLELSVPFFLFRLGLVCCPLDLFFTVPLHNCFVTTIKRKIEGLSLMCSPRFIFPFLCPSFLL